jgi:hypothetical protein
MGRLKASWIARQLDIEHLMLMGAIGRPHSLIYRR